MAPQLGVGFFWSHRSVGSHEPTKSKSVGETQVQIKRPLDYNQTAVRTAGKSPELRRQDKNNNRHLEKRGGGGSAHTTLVRDGQYRNGKGERKVDKTRSHNKLI